MIRRILIRCFLTYLKLTWKAKFKEKKLSKILGHNQTLFLIALTISAPIGAIIADVISLRFTMNCLAIVYFMAFLITLTFKEPKIKNENNLKSKKYLSILKEGFKELRRNKILRILCFDRIFIGVLIFFLFWTYQPYLQAINIPLYIFGFISFKICFYS